MLPSSSQWYQVRNLIFVHSSFAAEEALLLRAFLEGLGTPGFEHCNRVLWRSCQSLWLLRLHFAVVFCRNRSQPASCYGAAHCCTVHLHREPEPAKAVPNGLEVLEYLPPIFFSLEMACCYCGCSILANIFVVCCSVNSFNFKK